MSDILSARFNGVSFGLYDAEGNLVANSYALSGRPGHQNPSLQDQKNVGPIPEGTYTISPENIDYRDNLIEYFTWSEGWGNGRVTLIPDQGTNLHGRSGFFLHGST